MFPQFWWVFLNYDFMTSSVWLIDFDIGIRIFDPNYMHVYQGMVPKYTESLKIPIQQIQGFYRKIYYSYGILNPS